MQTAKRAPPTPPSHPTTAPPSQAELARQARDTRVAEVEAENEALKQALQRLEAAAAALQGSDGEAAGGAAGQGGASPGAAAAGSMRVAQLEGEANVLRRKVAELQKGMDRLQQVRGGCQGRQPGHAAPQQSWVAEGVHSWRAFSRHPRPDPCCIVRPAPVASAGVQQADHTVPRGRVPAVWLPRGDGQRPGGEAGLGLEVYRFWHSWSVTVAQTTLGRPEGFPTRTLQLTHPPATPLLPSYSSHPQAREFKAQFALRPQHAEGGADAQLLFRMLRDGRLVLVPTEMRCGVGQSRGIRGFGAGSSSWVLLRATAFAAVLLATVEWLAGWGRQGTCACRAGEGRHAPTAPQDKPMPVASQQQGACLAPQRAAVAGGGDVHRPLPLRARLHRQPHHGAVPEADAVLSWMDCECAAIAATEAGPAAVTRQALSGRRCRSTGSLE